MSIRSEIAVVSKSDLRTGKIYEQWSDPRQLARMLPQKVAAVLSNPMGSSDDEPVQLIGIVGNEVVGRVDLVAGSVNVDGDRLPLRWASALAVPPETRHTLIGLKLIREMQSPDATVGACGASQMVYPIYKSFGWTDFVMPRYVLLRHARSVIERKVGRLVAAMAAVPVDAGLALYTSLVLRDGLNGIDGRVDTLVPAELAKVLSCQANTFMPRSVETLDWRLRSRFRNEPRDRNLLLTLAYRGEVAAYALLKIRFHEQASVRGFRNVLLGSLQEWLIFDSKRLSFKTLVIWACRELLRQNVDAVEVCSTSEEEERVLRAMGMRRVGEVHLMWHAPPDTRLTAAKYHAQSSWMIRNGDGEAFFF